MNKLKCFGLAAVAGIFLMIEAPKMDAQVTVSVGSAPDCLFTAITTLLHMPALPTAIMGRNGLPMVSS